VSERKEETTFFLIVVDVDARRHRAGVEAGASTERSRFGTIAGTTTNLGTISSLVFLMRTLFIGVSPRYQPSVT
jgi:hypothetical protein